MLQRKVQVHFNGLYYGILESISDLSLTYFCFCNIGDPSQGLYMFAKHSTAELA
jgi:hypothetical protein